MKQPQLSRATLQVRKWLPHGPLTFSVIKDSRGERPHSLADLYSGSKFKVK